MLTPHQFCLLPNTCSQTQSSTHWQTGLCWAAGSTLKCIFFFFSSIRLNDSPTASHFSAFLTVFICSTPPLFLPLICLALPKYLHPVIPIFLLSHLPVFKSTSFSFCSLIPLLLFPHLSPELTVLFIILPIPHMLSNAFSVREMQSALIHWCIFFLPLSPGLSKGTSSKCDFQQGHPRRSWEVCRFSDWDTWGKFFC